MLTQSFNRYSWTSSASPTGLISWTGLGRTYQRSVVNFRSVRSENIGNFYSCLVYLMMRHPISQGASPPDDENHQVRQVLNKLEVIGPNWVDTNKDLLDTPGPGRLQLLSRDLERIVDFSGDLDDDMDDRAETRSKTGDAARGARTSKRRQISGRADDN